MLEFGNQNRTQHPTDANKQSSRSHAVFQVCMSILTALDERCSVVTHTCMPTDGSHILLQAEFSQEKQSNYCPACQPHIPADSLDLISFPLSFSLSFFSGGFLGSHGFQSGVMA